MSGTPLLLLLLLALWAPPARAQTATPLPTRTVPVEAFGAVGDGATDDTAAIQAAIEFCSAPRTGTHDVGCTVALRSATYVISAPLVITAANVGIKGTQRGWEGTGGSTIVQRSPNTDVVDIVHPQGSFIFGNFIEDMALVSGGGFHGDTNTAGSGIYVQGALATRIHGVFVLNAYMGIHLMGSRNVSIRDCHVNRPYWASTGTSYGIYIEDDGVEEHSNASNWINDTIISFKPHTTGDAFGLVYVGQVQDLTVRHLEINAADVGISLRRTSGRVNYDIQLSQVIIDQFNRHGVWLEGFTDGSPAIIGGWFANSVRSGEQVAVYSSTGSGLKLQGVEFFGYNSGNPAAIAVKIANAIHCQIAGNSFRNWARSVVIDASSNIVVSGNSFLNLAGNVTSPNQVSVGGLSNRVNVSGNTFSSSSNTAFAVSIESGTYNLVGMNTWTGPYLRGFASNAGGSSNLFTSNVGN